MKNLNNITFKGNADISDAFINCTKLENVTFESTGRVGGASLNDCQKLASLTFNNAITLTDGALVSYDSNPNHALTELVFPAGSKVENELFANYKALKSVTFEGDVALNHSVFQNCDALETVTFKGESMIGGSSFNNCPNIKTLTFEKKTTLTDGALAISSPLTNNSLTELVFPEGSKVENSLFSNYSALKSVTFEGDADLKQSVFSHCDALETVIFNGESVIGQGAFNDCPSLESVIFKKKTMLSESAFGCTGEEPNSAMTELVLPGDSTIKDYAFNNCSKLNTVTIKEGAKLGTRILPGCSALETFIFEADTPQDFESLTFTNFEPENITIYVPDVEKYKEALEQDTGSDLNEHYNIEFVDRLKKLHIHNLTLVPAKDATCTEDGNKAYYICDGCDKWFEDAQGKSEVTDKTSVIIPAAGHTLSDWKADDNSHWHECECGYKADAAQHSFKWVVDKEANATQKGAKHEECTVCGYKRAAVEIPATGTTIAPTTTPKKNSTITSAVKNPKTGDNSNIFL